MTEPTLFDAAVQEFRALFDRGRDLPQDVARAGFAVMQDLMAGEDTPDLVQVIASPTDDRRVCVMACPGWRLMREILRLRQCRTKH